MPQHHQPRGDHDPFSPHEPVGEPAVSDPPGGGGAPSVPVSLVKAPPAPPPPPPAPAPVAPPGLRRRRSRAAPKRADAALEAELAALGERDA